MKQNHPISKDLQESRQNTVNVGHNTMQSSQNEGVANANDVEKRPESGDWETEMTSNSSRISTEPQSDTNRVFLCGRHISSINMPSELAEVIMAWPALPAAIRAGIIAMVRTAAPADGNIIEVNPQSVE